MRLYLSFEKQNEPYLYSYRPNGLDSEVRSLLHESKPRSNALVWNVDASRYLRVVVATSR